MEIVQHAPENAVSILVNRIYEIWSLGGWGTCALNEGWVLSKE